MSIRYEVISDDMKSMLSQIEQDLDAMREGSFGGLSQMSDQAVLDICRKRFEKANLHVRVVPKEDEDGTEGAQADAAGDDEADAAVAPTATTKKKRKKKASKKSASNGAVEPKADEDEDAPHKQSEDSMTEYDKALALLMNLYTTGSKDAVRELLDEYKVAKFSEIEKDKGPELLRRALGIEAASLS